MLNKMRTLYAVLLLGVMSSTVYADDDTAAIVELTQLYNVTSSVCNGISDELQHLKNMTTGSAVVSGAGTVAAGGALYAGLSKDQIDQKIEQLQQQICDDGGCTEEGVAAMSDADFLERVIFPFSQILELQQLQEKSVRLGNWRTGLMAGATAANITSAILSGINRDQSDLIQHIDACNNAVDLVARTNITGLNPNEHLVVQKLQNIKTWCKHIDVKEIETFEKQQTVAMGTSIAGTVTGATGAITSAMANSQKVRDDNTADGRKKEKNLNTTANVMAGATTVLGGVSTGFNIASLTKINKIIKQVKLCEESF